MTTTRSYSCNLCRRSIIGDGAGVGLKWGSNDQIDLTTPSQAETHVCQACLGALEVSLYDQREMDRKREETATYCPSTD